VLVAVACPVAVVVAVEEAEGTAVTGLDVGTAKTVAVVAGMGSCIPTVGDGVSVPVSGVVA
jgi:hypothetical protein